MPAATTTIRLPLLSQIQIASPCSAKWEDMPGDGVARNCADCKLQVHNLSEMTSEAAEAFLQSRVGEGRVCARFYRRVDGTILTKDCPVGLALWRKRARWAGGRVAAALLFLGTGGFVATAQERESLSQRLRGAQPFRTVCEWVNPKAPPPPPMAPRPLRVPVLMGDICLPPPPTPAPAPPAAGTRP